ncbi:MAG: RND family transporter, partial [Thermodesulfobacteriota bacterium]
NIIGTEEGMEVIPFMEDVPQTNKEVQRLKKAVFDNDMFVGSIVSKDGTATLILTEPEEGVHRGEVYFRVKEYIDGIQERGISDRIYIAGRPVIEGVFGIYMPRDMQKMLPLIVGLIIIVLFLTFRSLRGIFLPLTVVIISVLWTLATMAILNIPMYTITTMMPIILIAIGVADGIHILSRHYDEFLEHPGEDRKTLVLNTMNEMSAPVIMTSLTSAAGFLANITSRMLPIRYFGIFTAIGIIYAMIFSLTFIPAALAILKPRSPKGAAKRMEAGGELKSATLSGRLLSLFGRHVFLRHRLISIFTGLVILISIYGVSNLYVDASLLSEFRREDPIRLADSVLNKKFSGTTSLNVVIETDEPDSMKSPEMLKKIDKLQSHLEALPEIGDTLSIAEFIKRMNRVMNEDRREMEVIPDSKELIAQYLLLYSFSGDPEDFDDIVDYEYKQANIRANLYTDHSEPVAGIIKRLRGFIDENFNDKGTQVFLAGTAYTTYSFVDIIISGQVQSLIIATIAIFLLTSFEFRSFFAGFLNIIPISLSTLIIYGIMGLVGYPLEIGTALTSGIALGVGVDYSIHFINKYRLEAQKTSDTLSITLNTMTTAGKAIFFNALVVTVGFLVLLKANLYP